MKKVISLFMTFVMLFGLISNFNLAVYASDREVTNLQFNIVKPYEIYEGTHTDDIAEGTNGWHYFFDEFNDGDSIVIDYTDNSTETYICKDGIFRKSDNEDKLMYIATYGFTYKGTGKTNFEYMIEDDVKSLWSGVLPITIIENPLETAVFTPIKSYEVVKNTRGYSDENGEWEYLSPYFNVGDKISVYMKDGSRKVYLYDLEKLPYESETECFYNQSDDNDYISVSTSDFKLNGTGRTSFDVKINEYNKVLQVPVTVVENSNIYSGTYGTNVKWTYNAASKKLNIYGYGDMPGSTNVSNIPWWDFHNDITSVEISSGVTSIGDSAFSSCSNLKSIIVPNTVTSIGLGAFDSCSNLKSVFIPNSVSFIDECAFSGCVSLTDVIIPSGVTSIKTYTFDGCKKLRTVTIPKSVTSINSAFDGCTNLRYVYFSGTSTQWNNIKYGSKIDSSSVTVYYNSCDHIFDSGKVINEPTCTTEGLTDYTCTKCGREYENIIAENGHKYDSYVRVKPTCTSKGYDNYYCTVCNADGYKTNYIDYISHKFGNYTYNNDATCTENGTKSATCSMCGTVNTIAASNTALGHNYVITVIKPTCIKKGYTTHVCKRCGNSYTDNYTNTTNHTYSSWKYNNDAKYNSKTDYTDGTATRTCSKCGTSETKTIEGTGLLRANSASVVLDASVTLNIGIDKSRTSPFESSFIRVEFGGESYDLNKPSSTSTGSRTYYDFDKISPDKFADVVTITPYGVTSDGIECKGHSVTYSIKDYCYSQLGKSTNLNLRSLLVELLYYGEAYQKYRDYNTNNLVTADLTVSQRNLHTTDSLDYKNVTNSKYQLNPNGTAKNEVNFKSASMLLEGKVIPRIKVEISSSKSISDYTFRWTVDGQNTEFTYAEHPDWFAQTNASASDKRAYYVDCPILNATQFSTPFYLTVFKNGTQVSNVLQYSVESYATGSTVKNNAKLKVLVDQMLRYGRAEKIRLGK